MENKYLVWDRDLSEGTRRLLLAAVNPTQHDWGKLTGRTFDELPVRARRLLLQLDWDATIAKLAERI